MAKVCESLGLEFEGEIRVHLSRGVFNQWDDYQVSVPALFYLKNRDLSKSAHVCGSVSWHEQRRSLRISEKELLLAGKRYKTISKEFGLHKSTVRQIVYK